MNERIQALYQQAHEPQPPTRGTGTLTKDILWEQPDKFNPEKFAELLVKECLKLCKEVEDDLAGIYEDAERDATQIGARFCYEAILSEFGVKE